MNPKSVEIPPPSTLRDTEIAETYLEAIRTKDPRKALLAPDVTWQFPMTPHKVIGREKVIEYMLSMLPGIDDVILERHMTGGDHVATVWQVKSVWGVLPICTVFQISDGLIRDVRSFWDPRPVLPKT